MSIKQALFAAITGAESTDIEIIEGVVPAAELAEAIVDKDYAEAATLIVEAEADLDRVEAKIEFLEDTLEELQEEVAGIEAMTSQDGKFDAALVHDRMTRAAKIAARLAGTKVEVGGVESFADKDSLLNHGGMESLKDTLKKGVETAIKFLKELFENLTAFVTVVFGRTTQIRNKLESLSKKDLQLKEGTVKLPESAKYVGENGKAPDVAKMYVDLTRYIAGNFDKEEAVPKMVDIMKDAEKEVGETGEIDASKLNLGSIKSNIKDVLTQVKTIETDGFRPDTIKRVMQDFIKAYESNEKQEDAAIIKKNARAIVSHIRTALNWCNKVYSAQISYVLAVTK